MTMAEDLTEHRFLAGDVRERLADEPDASVDLVVTSPPYWQIKDYDIEEQIGANQDYEDYLASLRSVWETCHRLLKPGCRLAVNVGDQYLRATDYGRYRVKPIPADTIRAGRAIGFDFMGNIIWHKVSTTETTGGGAWMGSTYHPKDGHVTYEHEYIILFRKRGEWSRPEDEEILEKSRLTKEQRSRWFRGYWELAPERQDDHVAKFPVELPARLIRMYSFHGETVLDPFLGSGTTALAARRHGRNSLGVELNPDYLELARERLGFREEDRREAEDSDGIRYQNENVRLRVQP